MPRVKQYPHYLFAITHGASTQDVNGDWQENAVTKTFISMCREEKDGRGQEFDVGGGKYHKCTSVIQCPKTCPVQYVGSNVCVCNDYAGNNVRITGRVLNCDDSQLHTRIWV